ncbi:type I restriction endonuclease subunit R [Emticicia sp. TH156]|uniref:type I restriction endonuclease subunit R n=1 Tax=Emticicia sp. TH156 TaxID=2067454 RepID=UPI000C78FF1B|nr:type I restriction endonuclease subunit R [Emticicia sp. TH156]PLK46115.1 DEAD/DEAH box helicase [Emticicia sp. TH156]
MTKLTETHIENLAIELLCQLGYAYIYAPDVAPDSPNPERESYAQVLLMSRLQAAVQTINPGIPVDAQAEAIREIQRIASPDMLTNNETFHRFLTEGVPVTVRIGGEDRGDRVWLIDFKNPANNQFVVASQYTIVENNHNKRPDLLLFVNGIPLVLLELKNAADANTTLHSAFRQVETYKALIPGLFTYNGFVVISDGLEAKAGTVSSGFSRFMAWKTADGKAEASHLVSQLETLIQGMLNPATLIDLVRHFIVFEKSKKTDTATGITSITTVKKIAAYHQYYAVNRAVESTLRASGYSPAPYQTGMAVVAEPPESYGVAGVSQQPAGDKKGGVVWHTQGSGKSLTMVFYTGKIVLALSNPTILVITDRNDLDDQLFDTFAASKQLLRQEPVQADDRNQLKDLLRVASGGVIFTTIQKFQPQEGNVYELLSDRTNIVVIADEAHRTQYGFRAKTIDDKDAGGNVIGKKIVYGFAKYMRDALPNATYLGFTGTPIESTDVNTPAVFGNYVDIYDIAQAVEDGATVRIYYESRLAKVSLSDEGRQLVEDLDDELEQEDLNNAQKAKAKWTQLEALIGSQNRISNIARDMVTHFCQRQEVFEGKGMIVTMSRRIAAELYEAIIALKPAWHSDDLNKGVIKVVMTSASSDGPQIARHHTTKEQRRVLAERMKNPDDELQLVIVRDMWLTGFDAPSMHTLYIDKPMQGHNLMQAIARVNRVYKDKPGGLVVDYLGVASDLKKALAFYTNAGGKGDPTELKEKAVQLMLEKLEVVAAMFHGFEYKHYFEADTSKKLSLILAAENFIMQPPDQKIRFINEVTALSRALALANPTNESMDVIDEISFFQAVKACVVKFVSRGSGRTDEEIETTIRQVIDKALVSEKVVDVFDAAGIKKPDISILSEEFLMELKGMQHKNVAFELLKKLLNDEIKARANTNMVQSKHLMEMLENSIRRYHNKIITSAEVLEEIITISKEIVKMDNEAKAMGLTKYEYGFYTAVANNDSAKELMQKEKLRELAIVLTETIRKNATIDWTIKESVRSGLRVAVKRLLRKYGYPPDMQLLATDTVLKQAEKMANEIAG